MVRRKITSTAMSFERLKEMEPEGARALAGSRRRRRRRPTSTPPSTRSDRARAPGTRVSSTTRWGRTSGGSSSSRSRAPGREDHRPLPPRRVRDLQGTAQPRQPRILEARRPRGARRRRGTYASDWGGASGARRCACSRPSPSPRRSRGPLLDRQPRARWGEPAAGAELRDNAAQRFVARYQVQRLAGALEVYRLENGEYPDRLDALVSAGSSPRATCATPGSRGTTTGGHPRGGTSSFRR